MILLQAVLTLAVDQISNKNRRIMSTLLLFILFAFLAFALWIGYTGYRSMRNKQRGGAAPGPSKSGTQRGQTGPPGAQPAETAQVPEADAPPKRPESEAGPKRPESTSDPERPGKNRSKTY